MSMMSYHHKFKTVNALCSCSFILLRRFAFQGRMKGLHHLIQPSRTIALSSCRTRNEQQRSKGERQQKSVLLVDEKGTKQREMSLAEARQIAKERSLELVWVNKHNTNAMPVYRMMCNLEIRSKNKARSFKPPKIKKIELTQNIESHDLIFKVKHIQQYLEKGHQVKLSVKSKRRTNSDVDSDDKLDVIKKVQQEMKGVKVDRPVQENPQLVTCVFKPIQVPDVKSSSSKT